MAYESQIIELLGNQGNPVRYNIADGNAIPRMTLLKIGSGERVAEASSSNNDAFAGISATEKVANDGVTTIDAYTCGLFYLNDNFEEPERAMKLRVSGANYINVVANEGHQQTANVGISIRQMPWNWELRSGEREHWHLVLVGCGL